MIPHWIPGLRWHQHLAKEQFDALVLGGGPAGCAAAIGLANSGARVALVERSSTSTFKPGEIVESSVRKPLFELGLLQEFEMLNFPRLAGSLSIWGDTVPIEFSGIVSVNGYGIVLERTRFESWLQEKARCAGVTLVLGASILQAKENGVGWAVDWISANNRAAELSTSIVIEATGRGRGALGFHHRRRVDNLVALLSYGSANPDNLDQRLVLESDENGWWYAARLPNECAVTAFMTDADQLPRRKADRVRYFNNRLNGSKLVRALTSEVDPHSKLIGFPANSSYRHVANGSNWVAIGDAAASYDPISGRGVSAAMAKGVAIARSIANSHNLTMATNAYADAEKSTFEKYLQELRSNYAPAAQKYRSPFWERRGIGVQN